MKESDAKKMVCPFLSNSSYFETCKGDRCMGWQKHIVQKKVFFNHNGEMDDDGQPIRPPEVPPYSDYEMLFKRWSWLQTIQTDEGSCGALRK